MPRVTRSSPATDREERREKRNLEMSSKDTKKRRLDKGATSAERKQVEKTKKIAVKFAGDSSSDEERKNKSMESLRDNSSDINPSDNTVVSDGSDAEAREADSLAALEASVQEQNQRTIRVELAECMTLDKARQLQLLYRRLGADAVEDVLLSYFYFLKFSTPAACAAHATRLRDQGVACTMYCSHCAMAKRPGPECCRAESDEFRDLNRLCKLSIATMPTASDTNMLLVMAFKTVKLSQIDEVTSAKGLQEAIFPKLVFVVLSTKPDAERSVRLMSNHITVYGKVTDVKLLDHTVGYKNYCGKTSSVPVSHARQNLCDALLKDQLAAGQDRRAVLVLGNLIRHVVDGDSNKYYNWIRQLFGLNCDVVNSGWLSGTNSKSYIQDYYTYGIAFLRTPGDVREVIANCQYHFLAGKHLNVVSCQTFLKAGRGTEPQPSKPQTAPSKDKSAASTKVTSATEKSGQKETKTSNPVASRRGSKDNKEPPKKPPKEELARLHREVEAKQTELEHLKKITSGQLERLAAVPFFSALSVNLKRLDENCMNPDDLKRLRTLEETKAVKEEAAGQIGTAGMMAQIKGLKEELAEATRRAKSAEREKVQNRKKMEAELNTALVEKDALASQLKLTKEDRDKAEARERDNGDILDKLNKEADKEIKRTQDALTDCKKSLCEALGQCKEKEVELNLANRKVDRLDKMLKTSAEGENFLQKQISKLQERTRQTEAPLTGDKNMEALNDRVRLQQEKIERYMADFVKLKTQRTEAILAKDKAEASMAVSESEKEELAKKLNKEEQLLRDLENELGETKCRAEAFKAEVDSLNLTQKEKDRLIGSLEEASEKLRGNLKEMESQKAKAEEENKAKLIEVEESLLQLVENCLSNLNVDKLDDSNRKALRKLKDEMLGNKSCTEQINEFLGLFSSIIKSQHEKENLLLSNWNSEVKRLEGDLRLAMAERQRLTNKVSLLESSVASLKTSLADLEREKAAGTSGIAVLKKQLSEKALEVERVASSKQEAEAELRQEIGHLQTDLAIANAKVQEYKEAVETAESAAGQELPEPSTSRAETKKEDLPESYQLQLDMARRDVFADVADVELREEAMEVFRSLQEALLDPELYEEYKSSTPAGLNIPYQEVMDQMYTMSTPCNNHPALLRRIFRKSFATVFKELPLKSVEGLNT